MITSAFGVDHEIEKYHKEYGTNGLVERERKAGVKVKRVLRPLPDTKKITIIRPARKGKVVPISSAKKPKITPKKPKKLELAS